MGSTNPGHEVSHHQNFLVSWSKFSLALLVTLFVAIPAITVSTWIIMCCLHFSFTPKSIHVDYKNTCYQRPFLPDQTAGKQGAVYSWPKQPDQDFHKINTRNPTCSNFIPVTREHVCTTHNPGGPECIWCSLLWRGPMLQMAAARKYIAEAQISL